MRFAFLFHLSVLFSVFFLFQCALLVETGETSSSLELVDIRLQEETFDSRVDSENKIAHPFESIIVSPPPQAVVESPCLEVTWSSSSKLAETKNTKPSEKAIISTNIPKDVVKTLPRRKVDLAKRLPPPLPSNSEVNTKKRKLGSEGRNVNRKKDDSSQFIYQSDVEPSESEMKRRYFDDTEMKEAKLSRESEREGLVYTKPHRSVILNMHPVIPSYSKAYGPYFFDSSQNLVPVRNVESNLFQAGKRWTSYIQLGIDISKKTALFCILKPSDISNQDLILLRTVRVPPRLTNPSELEASFEIDSKTLELVYLLLLRRPPVYFSGTLYKKEYCLPVYESAQYPFIYLKRGTFLRDGYFMKCEDKSIVNYVDEVGQSFNSPVPVFGKFLYRDYYNQEHTFFYQVTTVPPPQYGPMSLLYDMIGTVRYENKVLFFFIIAVIAYSHFIS